MTNIQLIEELIEQAQNLKYKDGKLDEVTKRAKMIIRKSFGENSEYLKDLKGILYSPFVFTSNTPYSTFERSFYSGKKELLNLLNVMLEDLSLDLKLSKKVHDTVANGIFQIMNDETNKEMNKNIFVVHGHNEEMKLSVARTLEKLELLPTILHEQPNKGRTIIEKFTEYSDVGFAVVILSADDIAYPKSSDGSNPKHRARQNVILELGYFLGKLGREKVLALYEENSALEIPSDYMGVLFVAFDKYGKWQYDLVKELRAAGFDVDANKII